MHRTQIRRRISIKEGTIAFLIGGRSDGSYHLLTPFLVSRFSFLHVCALGRFLSVTLGTACAISHQYCRPPEAPDVGECTDLDAAQCLAKRDHVVPQFLLAIPHPLIRRTVDGDPGHCFSCSVGVA